MLKITFVNVGYGDSILIEEFRDEKRVFSMLVDGGLPYSGAYCRAYDSCPGRTPIFKYLQSHGIQSLDAMLLSHLHIDHVGGLPAVMQTCALGKIWSSYILPEADCLQNLNALCLEQQTAIETRLSLNLLAKMRELAAAQGKQLELMGEKPESIALTERLRADFFAIPPSLREKTDALIRQSLAAADAPRAQIALLKLDGIQNAAGIALRLKYSGVSILLPADLPYLYWNAYLSEPGFLKADILKIAHHGQSDSMTPELAKAILPRHVVMSVSADNPFGAPERTIFTMFDPATHFWTTDAIEIPRYVQRTQPHRAVVFEISPEGTINSTLESV